MVMAVSAIRLAIHRPHGRADHSHLLLRHHPTGILREKRVAGLRTFQTNERCDGEALAGCSSTNALFVRGWRLSSDITIAILLMASAGVCGRVCATATNKIL